MVNLPNDDVPRDWVREQMERAELPQDVRSPIWQLLNTWQVHRSKTSDPKLALETFLKLALDQPLESKAEQDTKWVPVKPGNIYMRDRVRVKTDAYTGKVGRVHNGKTGLVVRITGGDVVVKYDSPSPGIEVVHHSPYALEKAS